MLNLSLADLELFARISCLGKLSAVARERNVPTSQISRALQRIEAQCQAQLVRRNTRGLSLTPEGENLRHFALRTLDDAQALDALLHPSHNRPSGLVRVSMSSVIAQHLMVHTIASLHEAHPMIELDFRVDDSLIDMAREGIDIAIRTGSAQSDALVIRPLGQLHRRLYASPDYLYRRGVPTCVDDLAHHALIVNSLHEHLNLWRFKSGQELRARGPWMSDHTATLTSMAVTGLGIARMASVVAQPLVEQGRLTEVLGHEIEPEVNDINAFMLAGRHRLPKIRACLDHWAKWCSGG